VGEACTILSRGCTGPQVPHTYQNLLGFIITCIREVVIATLKGATGMWIITVRVKHQVVREGGVVLVYSGTGVIALGSAFLHGARRPCHRTTCIGELFVVVTESSHVGPPGLVASCLSSDVT
jgi:hypothetical protein